MKITKTEKNEKSFKILKLCNIINFKTIRYKLTAPGNIILSIVNYKLRAVSILRLPKNKKTVKNSKFKKKLGEKSVEAIKKETFQ